MNRFDQFKKSVLSLNGWSEFRVLSTQQNAYPSDPFNWEHFETQISFNGKPSLTGYPHNLKNFRTVLSIILAIKKYLKLSGDKASDKGFLADNLVIYPRVVVLGISTFDPDAEWLKDVESDRGKEYFFLVKDGQRFCGVWVAHGRLFMFHPADPTRRRNDDALQRLCNGIVRNWMPGKPPVEESGPNILVTSVSPPVHPVKTGDRRAWEYNSWIWVVAFFLKGVKKQLINERSQSLHVPKALAQLAWSITAKVVVNQHKNGVLNITKDDDIEPVLESTTDRKGAQGIVVKEQQKDFIFGLLFGPDEVGVAGWDPKVKIASNAIEWPYIPR